MLIDSAIVYGLTVWDRRLKEQREVALREEALHREIDKKDKRATRAAQRQQRKAAQKKQHNVPYQNSVPKQKIMQPDKSKKM
jgi:hypothetical protein